DGAGPPFPGARGGDAPELAFLVQPRDPLAHVHEAHRPGLPFRPRRSALMRPARSARARGRAATRAGRPDAPGLLVVPAPVASGECDARRAVDRSPTGWRPR